MASFETVGVDIIISSSMVDLGSDGLLVLLKDRREILRANDDANLAMIHDARV